MEFLRSRELRQRYWARNYVAWPRFSNVQPNAVHLALTRLQREGRINTIITQNVDRLHGKAGSKNVLELHGCGYKVICLSTNCDYSIDRHDLQMIFDTMNRHPIDTSEAMRPDGDIELPLVMHLYFGVFLHLTVLDCS